MIPGLMEIKLQQVRTTHHMHPVRKLQEFIVKTLKFQQSMPLHCMTYKVTATCII